MNTIAEPIYPDEPYYLVRQLFDADANAQGSTYYNRDEWIVISANEIKHRDTLDILLSVGQVMTKHTIIMSKQDYDCLGPSQQAEIDASSSVASIAALSEKEITITGSGSLMSRPMDFFDEILPQLGVKVESNGGKLPLKVRGPLVPGNITVDGNLSSQYTTGLLMAYAAAGAKGVSIHVRNPTSKPYIDLTLEVMRSFGMEVPENRHYEEFVFHGKPEKNTAPGQCQYTVESDWSGGAFLLVAGAIAGPITVCGLRQESTQADKAIMKALKSAGAGIKVHEDKIQIYPSELKGFLFDATDCPDLFPPLVALAAYCRGETIIRGAERLTHKESNRALSLQSEFGKMGVVIDLAGNNMTIHGSCEVQGAEVSSWHDHRIAMACAVAALKAKGGMTITDAEAVGKSYPGFFEDMRTLGADLEA